MAWDVELNVLYLYTWCTSYTVFELHAWMQPVQTVRSGVQ